MYSKRLMADLSFSEMIDKWPTRTALALDLGVTQQAVNAMIIRDSIDGRYWAKMVLSASARGIVGVTLQALALAADEARVAALAKRKAKRDGGRSALEQTSPN